MNGYNYPLNPLSWYDSLGLWKAWDDARSGACAGGFCEFLSLFIGPKKYTNHDDAAMNVLTHINKISINENREYAGMICQNNKNRCFSTEPIRGSLAGANPHNSPCPAGTSPIGDYHTHGNYSDVHGNPIPPASDAYDSLYFSATDINGITSDGRGIIGYTGYLGTPAETYFKYTPRIGTVEELK